MGPPDARDRRVTRLFLLAVLLHGLVYLCAVAPWMGEDEPWHLEYASQVADGHLPWGGRAVSYGSEAQVDERTQWATSQLQARRRFHGVSDEQLAARQREILEAMRADDYFRRVDWAGAMASRTDFDQIERYFTATSQPPGYYVLLGAWLAPWPGESVDSELLWGRVLSLLLYVATAWCGLEFARRVFSDRALALAAALAIAWFPMHARQAALVNNDVLARALSAAVLMLCARRLAGEGRRLEFGLALGLALLAPLVKPTAASALGVLIVALLVQSRAVASLRRVIAFALGGAGVLAAAVWVLHVQHSPVLPRNVGALVKRVTAGLSGETFVKMGTSFVGEFNWYSRAQPAWVYVLAAVLGAAALVSALAALKFERPGVSRPALVLCLAAFAIQLALVVFRGVGHGRYLMPALPAIAALFVVGLLAPVPERLRPRAVALFAAALVAYDALFLWGGLVPNEYLLWGS